MTGLLVLTVLILATLLWVGLGILQEVRRLRELAEKQAAQKPGLTGKVNSSFAAITTNYSIWCWRGSCWELELGSVPPGFEPGALPKFQGTFVGQRVKSECARR